jgi:hypothetical protein
LHIRDNAGIDEGGRIQDLIDRECQKHEDANDDGPDVILLGHKRAKAQGFLQIPSNAG